MIEVVITEDSSLSLEYVLEYVAYPLEWIKLTRTLENNDDSRNINDTRGIFWKTKCLPMLKKCRKFKLMVS